jgi:UDP-N-acetylmuramyl pentapeptide phosphotransferase/UDP-N-acetylglucosamine-1-phosphate transferase
VFKSIAIDFGLADKPNARKDYDREVPLIGGISIFVAVLYKYCNLLAEFLTAMVKELAVHWSSSEKAVFE